MRKRVLRVPQMSLTRWPGEGRFFAGRDLDLQVMHHKRKGSKSTRAGCLLCKPEKHPRVKGGIRMKRNLGWRRHEELATDTSYGTE